MYWKEFNDHCLNVRLSWLLPKCTEENHKKTLFSMTVCQAKFQSRHPLKK